MRCEVCQVLFFLSIFQVFSNVESRAWIDHAGHRSPRLPTTLLIFPLCQYSPAQFHSLFGSAQHRTHRPQHRSSPKSKTTTLSLPTPPQPILYAALRHLVQPKLTTLPPHTADHIMHRPLSRPYHSSRSSSSSHSSSGGATPSTSPRLPKHRTTDPTRDRLGLCNCNCICNSVLRRLC